jgi:hypothetical protein
MKVRQIKERCHYSRLEVSGVSPTSIYRNGQWDPIGVIGTQSFLLREWK